MTIPEQATVPELTDEERNDYALEQTMYAAFAPFYDLVALPLRSARRDVAALAGTDARSRVLDIATGTGAQARAFAETAGEVVGIDLPPICESIMWPLAPNRATLGRSCLRGRHEEGVRRPDWVWT
jgi:protein-L-isoaspartate O-methyltransferase